MPPSMKETSVNTRLPGESMWKDESIERGGREDAHGSGERRKQNVISRR